MIQFIGKGASAKVYQGMHIKTSMPLHLFLYFTYKYRRNDCNKGDFSSEHKRWSEESIAERDRSA